MGKAVINITIALGLILIAFAGYYLYMNGGANSLNSVMPGERLTETAAKNTEQFISYRETLESIELDTSIVSDSRFANLRSFSVPVADRPVGRENPFLDTDVEATALTEPEE